MTSSSAEWQVLGFPTPPVPDYPSAHAAAGGAAAAVIRAAVAGPIGTLRLTSASLTLASRGLTPASMTLRVRIRSRESTSDSTSDTRLMQASSKENS